MLESAGATVVLLTTQAASKATGIDVEDEASVAGAFDAVITMHGQPDIVVHAASLPGTYEFADMTLGQWDQQQAVNLRGAFIVMREAVRRMRTTGGRIIAVSSMGALHPVLHGNAGYGAAKAGLNAMVRAVALDNAKQGVLVNAVLPGAVPARPMAENSAAAFGPALMPGQLTLGMGLVEDVAAAILYFASPAGRFITGQSLIVDGGFLLS